MIHVNIDQPNPLVAQIDECSKIYDLIILTNTPNIRMKINS